MAAARTAAATRLATALAASCVLGGCSGMQPGPNTNMVNFGGQLAFGAPVTSLIGRRFETVVRQQFDFSCGSAALATLLSFHYEDPQSERAVFLGMWNDGDKAQIRQLGFSLLDMKRYLAGRGVSADGFNVTLDQIGKARVPGIALIDFNGYKHFVVVKGVERGSVLLGDPALGLRRETARTFLRQWNGVFFVLNSRPEVAARHFNQAADLVRAPNGRLFGEADPLSATALALTRTINIGPAFTEF